VVALTFDPHPLAVLAPDRAPVPLTTIARRTELLLEAGADDVAVARFSAEYAKQTADGWVESELVERLCATHVVVGVDFRFGAGRIGDLSRLGELGDRLGFEVRPVELIARADERVSSTRIRAALRDGDVRDAAGQLGRVHDVEGTVVHGFERGRTIGFPTANLDSDAVLLPRDGVYAVVARVGGRALGGVANLGTRPTFAAGRSVEVHLFDFQGDLYGQRLRVGFVERLRDEQKFDSIEALVAQIHRDAEAARALFAREGLPWR
jgi:riboflavin kinase/FMN adenylyltransferase